MEWSTTPGIVCLSMIRPCRSTISTSRYLQIPLLAHLQIVCTTWPSLLEMKRNVLENWSLGVKTEGIRGGMHHLHNVLKSRASVSAAHFVFKCQVTSTETGSSGICEIDFLYSTIVALSWSDFYCPSNSTHKSKANRLNELDRAATRKLLQPSEVTDDDFKSQVASYLDP